MVDWATMEKDQTQTKFVGDRIDVSGLNEKAFVSGNDCQSTKETTGMEKLHEFSERNGDCDVTEADSSSLRQDFKETQAEIDQIDACDLKGRTTTCMNSPNGLENSSEDTVVPCKKVYEREQSVVSSPKEPLIALPSHESKESSGVSEISARDEGDAGNAVWSVAGKDESQTQLSDHKVEDGKSMTEQNCVPREIVGSNNEKAEMADTEEMDRVHKELQAANENETDIKTSSTVSSVLQRNRSKNSRPLPTILTRSNSGQQQSLATDKPCKEEEEEKAVSSLRSDKVSVDFQNEMDSFLDLSNQEWSDLDFGGVEATFISTEMEGWQRFDTQETITGADSKQRPRGWEDLLDDGVESNGKNDAGNYVQLASPSVFKEHHAELPSPRNPFVEEVGKTSSFSATDSLARRKELFYTDGLSQIEETPHSKDNLINQRTSFDPLPGIETTEKAKDTVESSTLDGQSVKSHLQSSSLDFMEPFEAPSFMSLVDPKSHALFEAYMPTYQSKQPRNVYESRDEKWIANFDLVAPSTQEINRSISMPRTGSDVMDQRPGQSSSFTVNREQETNKKEHESPSVYRSLSGLLTPKLSPLVQKVVEKVKNTPAAANGVLDSVRQVVSPKAPDKTQTSQSFFTRCMCW